MAQQDSLQTLLAPLVTRMGYVLWGLEYRAGSRSALLRLFIDREGGITLDDCTEVSRQVSAVLDVEDPIRVPYTLEVSSPGVDRPLFEAEQYARYVGHRVRVRTQWPVGGQRNFSGEIISADAGVITLQVDGEEVRIPLESVARGRLLGELPESGKQSE